MACNESDSDYTRTMALKWRKRTCLHRRKDRQAYKHGDSPNNPHAYAFANALEEKRKNPGNIQLQTILRYLTRDLRKIPKKRMSKASNIFDSLVMIMTRGNVIFMKCT